MSDPVEELGYDWNAIKLEFVTGHASLEDLARKYGIKPSTVRNRATGKKTRDKENWNEARDAWRHKVTAAAEVEIAKKQASELAKFNMNTLKIAHAILGQAGKHFVEAQEGAKPRKITAKDLRLLSAASADAQKIGRLALGTSTDNHEHTGQGGGPIATAQVSKEEYLEARARVIEEF